MAKKNPGIRRDANQDAARIAALPTRQRVLSLSKSEEKKLRSEAASILGKLGGSKGGKARAAILSSSRRAEIAQKAAAARWSQS
jgi:hypothetical protein